MSQLTSVLGRQVTTGDRKHRKQHQVRKVPPSMGKQNYYYSVGTLKG